MMASEKGDCTMISKKLSTTVRCIPRFGYADTEVRTIDLNLRKDADESILYTELTNWFEDHGIEDAVYDVSVDNNGYIAIVNDDAYDADWGEPLL